MEPGCSAGISAVDEAIKPQAGDASNDIVVNGFVMSEITRNRARDYELEKRFY
jgi:hypothetical protein